MSLDSSVCGPNVRFPIFIQTSPKHTHTPPQPPRSGKHLWKGGSYRCRTSNSQKRGRTESHGPTPNRIPTNITVDSRPLNATPAGKPAFYSTSRRSPPPNNIRRPPSHRDWPESAFLELVSDPSQPVVSPITSTRPTVVSLHGYHFTFVTRRKLTHLRR